jgi:hypothetical protein
MAKRTSTPKSKDDHFSRPRAAADHSEVHETWIDRRLQSLHQAVIEEPLPADVVEMLSKGSEP